MKQAEHPNDGSFIVTRKLRLMGLTSSNIPMLETEINEAVGIEKISLKLGPASMRVTYDASLTGIDSILGLLSKSKVNSYNNWWTRYKLNWDRQIDSNIKANANYKAHCCSKPPPGK